jgi:hypothetical protein
MSKPKGRQKMFGKTWLKMGICLIIIAALLCGVFLPAAAAGMSPKVSVIGVAIDSKVQIQAMYLPADTSFAVRMGKSGTMGIGAPIVANIESSADGIIFASVEILTDLKGKSPIDLRLEGGGVAVYTSFDNSKKNSFESHMLLPAPAAAVAPAPAAALVPVTGAGGAISPASDQVVVKKVEKHGYVVAAIYGLKKDVNYKIYVSEVGKTYYQGNAVGGVTLSKTQTTEVVGTFEIPYELRNKLQLTLHVVGPDTVLMQSFENKNK